MASQARVSVIDVRAGGLSGALSALEEIGFFEAVRSGEFGFVLLHVIGPSIASLDEIAAIAPYVADAHYFIVKNHVNDTTFFEWDMQTHAKYFEDVTASGEITIPRLRERAYEEVELAGTPFSTFIENRTAEGETADHSVRSARLCPFVAGAGCGRIRTGGIARTARPRRALTTPPTARSPGTGE